ncbi:GntR family transcriptional regulator [Streptomyces pathocidini]
MGPMEQVPAERGGPGTVAPRLRSRVPMQEGRGPVGGPSVGEVLADRTPEAGSATLSSLLSAPPHKLPQRYSVRGQVLDALRAALVSGELVPGEVYSAPGLAGRYGVSATPVREAMQQLACEGAVEVVPNRGFRVARRTARDLAELAEIRALIEVPVMLDLARAVDPDVWEDLRPLAAEAAAAAAGGDRVGYAESDRAFHRALLSLTGNRQLALLGDDLHRRAQGPVGDVPAACPADLLADAAEHTALLDALAAQDLAVVEQLVREHFTGARG